jgi:hypothetical protein
LTATNVEESAGWSFSMRGVCQIQAFLIEQKERKMTDHVQSAAGTIASVPAHIRANGGRLATAAAAALALLTLVWALTEEARLPDAQRSELFAVMAQAYP